VIAAGWRNSAARQVTVRVHQVRCRRHSGHISARAFSSEVDTGLREENALKQESGAPFRFYRNEKGSRRSLGRQFEWLWAAYAASAFGTWLGFGAFPLIAILVLHSGPTEVSALAAAGLAVGRWCRCRSARGSNSAASGR
jgi:hypothetical protein